MYTVPTREIASMLQSDQFCQRSQGHGPPRPQQREPPARPGGGSGLTVAKAIRTRLGAAQRWQEDLARADPERGRVCRAPGRTGGRRRSAFPGAPNVSAGDRAPPAGHTGSASGTESQRACASGRSRQWGRGAGGGQDLAGAVTQARGHAEGGGGCPPPALSPTQSRAVSPRYRRPPRGSRANVANPRTRDILTL